MVNKRLQQDEVKLETLDGIIVESLLRDKKVVIPDFGYLEIKELPEKKTVLFRTAKKSDSVSSGAGQKDLFSRDEDASSSDKISRLLSEGKDVILPELGVFRIVNLDDGSQRVIFTPSSRFRERLNTSEASKETSRVSARESLREKKLAEEVKTAPPVKEIIEEVIELVQVAPEPIEEPEPEEVEVVEPTIIEEPEAKKEDEIEEVASNKRFKIRLLRRKEKIQPPIEIEEEQHEDELPIIIAEEEVVSEPEEEIVIIAEPEPIIEPEPEFIPEPKVELVPEVETESEPEPDLKPKPSRWSRPELRSKPEPIVIEEMQEEIEDTDSVDDEIFEIPETIKRDSPKVGDVLIPEDDRQERAPRKINWGIIIRVAVILVVALLIAFIVFKREGKEVYSNTTVPSDKPEAVDLLSVAEKEYGNSIFWVYIYESNRDKLKSPVNIPEGTQLYIPDLLDYNVDITDSLEIKRAILMADAILRTNVPR